MYWQYKTIEFPAQPPAKEEPCDYMGRMLYPLGADGWEIAYVGNSMKITALQQQVIYMLFVFKRPCEERPDPPAVTQASAPANGRKMSILEA